MTGKIAQGTSITGTDREALAAFVNMGDTSVPGIEPSDLNDGDILARTRENVNPNGQFQFIYIPEDGSENITSDWISQEHKKKVTLSWVEGVKAAIIGRAQAGLREANEKAAEERLKRIQKEQMEDDTGEIVVEQPVRQVLRQAVSTSSTSARGESRAAKQGVSSDPAEYVADQLGQAAERLKSAEELLREYTKEVFLAKKDHAKWQALAMALSNTTDAEPNRERIAVSSVPLIALSSH
jgi:hypothetical protein